MYFMPSHDLCRACLLIFYRASSYFVSGFNFYQDDTACVYEREHGVNEENKKNKRILLEEIKTMMATSFSRSYTQQQQLLWITLPSARSPAVFPDSFMACNVK